MEADSADAATAAVTPFGPELDADGVRFRFWAPALHAVTLHLDTSGGEPPVRDAATAAPAEHDHAMTREADGWFECRVPGVRPGARYRFGIGLGLRVPDPGSRFQPVDCHGPSEVVDPRAHRWRCTAWRGRPWHEAVVYELHLGTFTREGTFRAAIERLDALAELGITALEILPVADFPGRRNWGYDGVLPYAPDSSYGRPEDFKALVDAAHERGLMVLLDVVYSHFGPDGNYLGFYAPDFFTRRHATPWGAAVNFDGRGPGENSRWVREYAIGNALYWLEEFRLDGLRLDAVHAIADDSRPDVIEELATRVRARFAGRREIHLVLENARNAAHYLFRDARGRPKLCTAQWNDDVHHALHVLATGETHGYYLCYAADPLRHLARCLAEGFAWQGERSPYSGAPRGEPSGGLPPGAFLGFLQNHDQVGNRAFGERLAHLVPPGRLEPLTALLLLAPHPPLLWMGEEWGASAPFQYFCDFGPELAALVREGRRREFARFPAFADPALRERIPDPNAPGTFERSKLDWTERERGRHARWLALYREFLALRRRHVVPFVADGVVEARVERPSAGELCVEWRSRRGGVLTLLLNVDERPATFASPPGPMIWPPVPGELQSVVPPWGVQWYLQPPRSSAR